MDYSEIPEQVCCIFKGAILSDICGVDEQTDMAHPPDSVSLMDLLLWQNSCFSFSSVYLQMNGLPANPQAHYTSYKVFYQTLIFSHLWLN